MTQMNVFVKQKRTQRERRDSWLSRGKVCGGTDWEFGISRYKYVAHTPICKHTHIYMYTYIHTW